jgi:hypothetical protein
MKVMEADVGGPKGGLTHAQSPEALSRPTPFSLLDVVHRCDGATVPPAHHPARPPRPPTTPPPRSLSHPRCKLQPVGGPWHGVKRNLVTCCTMHASH